MFEFKDDVPDSIFDEISMEEEGGEMGGERKVLVMITFFVWFIDRLC